MGSNSPEDKALYSGADTGFIAQNLYLFAASEGLATRRARLDKSRRTGRGPSSPAGSADHPSPDRGITQIGPR
jgi:hypothetical protein